MLKKLSSSGPYICKTSSLDDLAADAPFESQQFYAKQWPPQNQEKRFCDYPRKKILRDPVKSLNRFKSSLLHGSCNFRQTICEDFSRIF